MKLRNLTPDEIYILEKQGCSSTDWMKMLVRDPFQPELIWHSTFEGSNILGSFTIEDDELPSNNFGIFHSRLINCEIGDLTYINHLKCLENYIVGDRCRLEDVGKISANGESTFGNGTELEVLNEAGGRTLPIFDILSSQIAWMIVKARHDKKFVEAINEIIQTYVKTKKSNKGIIGSGTNIRHTSTVINVMIGENAELVGVGHLEDGTIRSETGAETKIGQGVVGKHFIVQEGSQITEGAILDSCFIGQAVKIGKQFSAENSVFFANSECFHGEGCSVFGGPYTVSHHKSSLLIAGEYSFYNAGSGTNQSNHMYKLGPMHQGIVERGSKTGSFSYMLWPSRVGPFSVVMGKHTTSFDAGDFPFSYITEEQGKSMLTPAMNLFTVGTKRDIQKWPTRDRRKSQTKFDKIIFDLYSPYLIQKVKKAIKKLDDLYQKTPKEQDLVFLNGLHVHRLMLKTCRKYYELALNVFFGEGILYILNKIETKGSISELRKLASKTKNLVAGDWIDASGLFLPLSDMEDLFEKTKKKEIKSIEEIHNFFSERFDLYANYKISFFQDVLKEVHNIELSQITRDQVTDIIGQWKTASLKLNNMILKDAQKEFDANSHIGYGIFPVESVRDADFIEVHGHFEENGFVKGLKAEIELIDQKSEELKASLR